MNRITFSVEDLKTPDKLERVLQQFKLAVETPITAQPTKFSPQSIDMQALAQNLAALVKPELQATGSSPLNTQNLLPSGTPGFVLPGAALLTLHAERPDPLSYPPGTLMFETDRTVLYYRSTSGTWTYSAGFYYNTHANAPTDLGISDAGFPFEVSDYAHVAIWDGGAWRLIDGGGGYFIDSAVALGTGWQLCDGSATDFILNNTTNLALQPFTTPNENGTPGVHHVSIAAYTGVINGPTAPGVSFTSGSSIAGVTLNKVLDNVPNAGPDTVLDTATSITDPGHTHGIVGTATLLGDPTTTMGVLRYFRR